MLAVFLDYGYNICVDGGFEMNDIYTIELSQELFDRFINDKNKYLVVINFPKRSVYKTGNILTVVKKENGVELEKKQVVIKGFLYFETLKELVEMVGKKQLGYSAGVTTDKIEDIYNRFNKNVDIQKHGLMAIEYENI